MNNAKATTMEPKDFGWVLLELMGHRQRVGQAREEMVAGGVMLRIDIPVQVEGEDLSHVTEYYGTPSIYAMRPISEEVAQTHWAQSDPRPTKPATYRPAIELDDGYEDEEPF